MRFKKTKKGENILKATGIVRRIDDLGRIVIPKEIRRILRIREGDPLEIFTENDSVIFKKYSPLGELRWLAEKYASVLYKTSGYPVLVCDSDTVIAVAGLPRTETIDRRVSAELDHMVESREFFKAKASDDKVLTPIEGLDIPAITAATIIANGDTRGSIMLMDKENAGTEAGETEIKLIATAAAFLGKEMED